MKKRDLGPLRPCWRELPALHLNWNGKGEMGRPSLVSFNATGVSGNWDIGVKTKARSQSSGLMPSPNRLLWTSPKRCHKCSAVSKELFSTCVGTEAAMPKPWPMLRPSSSMMGSIWEDSRIGLELLSSCKHFRNGYGLSPSRQPNFHWWC